MSPEKRRTTQKERSHEESEPPPAGECFFLVASQRGHSHADWPWKSEFQNMNGKSGMSHTFAPTSDRKNSITDGLTAVKSTENSMKMPVSIALSLARLANDHDPGERQCFLPQQRDNKSFDNLQIEGGEKNEFVSEDSSLNGNNSSDQLLDRNKSKEESARRKKVTVESLSFPVKAGARILQKKGQKRKKRFVMCDTQAPVTAQAKMDLGPMNRSNKPLEWDPGEIANRNHTGVEMDWPREGKNTMEHVATDRSI